MDTEFNLKKNPIVFIIAVFLLILLPLLYGSFYKINEDEQIIVTQFGKPVNGPFTTPGWRFKIASIQSVVRFPKGEFEWRGKKKEYITEDSDIIVIDLRMKWYISDPIEFYKRLHSIERVPGFLNSKFDENFSKLTAEKVMEQPHMLSDANSFREELYRTLFEMMKKDLKTVGLRLSSVYL